MDYKKFDQLPTIEQVIKFAEMRKTSLKVEEWNKDQKPDFYLGMMAAMRVFVGAVISVKEGEADIDRLEMECHFRMCEIATIVMDKYDLSTFKQSNSK